MTTDSTGGLGGVGGGPAKRAGNGRERPSTVLVVEDEIMVRMPVADYLRECGYRVLEASNAAEAQAIFAAEEPVEIVFSDVNMPGEMNGFALARWIRQTFPDVKVILTSGVTNIARSAAEICEEGNILPKPYAYETLAAHIKRLLGGLDD